VIVNMIIIKKGACERTEHGGYGPDAINCEKELKINVIVSLSSVRINGEKEFLQFYAWWFLLV